MSEPDINEEALLIDVSGMRIDELMQSKESPLLDSLRRIAASSNNDPIAGFNQGLA